MISPGARARGVRRARFGALACVLAVLAAALAGCLAGGGTDVGNPEFARITGSLKRPDGSPVADFPLRLRSRDHWSAPDTGNNGGASASGPAQDRHTDSQGFFAFDSVPKGAYRIEGADTSGQGVSIDVDVDLKRDRLVLQPALLRPTGSIAGAINWLGPIAPNYPKIIIAAYGTDHATLATFDGSYILSNLPPGRYRLHVSTASDSLAADAPEIEVKAGERAQAGTVDLGP